MNHHLCLVHCKVVSYLAYVMEPMPRTTTHMDIYMEDFKQRALAEATDPPSWWKRYVDDTTEYI